MSKGNSGHFEGTSGEKRHQEELEKAFPERRDITCKFQESKEDLIREVKRRGEKITPEEVIAIFRDGSGRIVWLEVGQVRNEMRRGAGLRHILDRHFGEFEKKGLAVESIVELIVSTVRSQKPVGTAKTSNPLPSTVYKAEYNGKRFYLAVSVGSNGFIVGANPIAAKKILFNNKKGES